jgi:hypothetical protein
MSSDESIISKSINGAQNIEIYIIATNPNVKIKHLNAEFSTKATAILPQRRHPRILINENKTKTINKK